jgi:hypothetical protein
MEVKLVEFLTVLGGEGCAEMLSGSLIFAVILLVLSLLAAVVRDVPTNVARY